MNILHISLLAPFNEGWGYQENLLPKYQQKLGNNVTLITTDMMSDKKHDFIKTGYTDKKSVEGFRLIRVPLPQNKLLRLLNWVNIKKYLNEVSPDIIMFHNLSSTISLQAIAYSFKHKNCKIVADNHEDENNTTQPNNIKDKVIHLFWILYNAFAQCFYSKVFGVTDGRVDYAHMYYKIAKKRLDVLPAGADNDFIDFNNKESIRREIRNKLGFSDDDFVLITGGKIDLKKNTDKLIKSIKNLNVKLIIFGSMDSDSQQLLAPLIDNDQIKYIGWVDSKDIYNYYFASDLACFPGLHSVLWEQACACGLPAIFNDIKGLHHVDVGGNCAFVNGNDSNQIKMIIYELYSDKSKYDKMKNIAEIEGIEHFSYYYLAKKAMLK